MEQAPLFSICIPAHNARDVIGMCLDSVARQACDDWEVIVVDDASDDDLGELCATQDIVPAERLTYVRLDENQGPFRARRRAFSLARGRYVVCLDADDEFIGTDALSSMRDVIEASSPDVLMFNMSATEHGGDSIIDYGALGLHEGPIERDALVEAFLATYALNNLATKVIRRELLAEDDAEVPEGLKMCEDRLEVSGVITRAKSASLLDRDLYFYRPNEASTTHRRFEVVYCEQQAFVERRVWERLGAGAATRDGQYALLLGAWAHDMEALVQGRDDRDLVACLEEMAAEPLFVEAMDAVGTAGQRPERARSLQLLRKGRVRAAARWVRALVRLKGAVKRGLSAG